MSKVSLIKVFFPLLVIGGLCGTLLVLTNQWTAADIQANREARTRALLEEMLGQPMRRLEASAQLNIEDDIFGSCATWLFIRAEAAGYAGPIYLTALWRPNELPSDDETLSMRVVAHQETPGIGDFIDHSRSPWITDLDNSSAQTYAQLDAVSGATITSNAIKRVSRELFNQVEFYCDR